MTFASFKTAVKAIAFPKGEAENLVTVHNAFIAEALLELQRAVPCFQVNHVDVIRQCSTYFYCGMSVFDGVDGEIKRLYVMDERRPCDKVFCTQETRAALECRVKYNACDCFDLPYTQYVRNDALVDYPSLPLGFYYPNYGSDSGLGRAAKGWFALENNSIYVFPHIESTESVAVEWKGIKKSWSDSDLVFDDGLDVQRAVRLFLRREVARELDCDREKVRSLDAEFREARKDLIWQCRKKMDSAAQAGCAVLSGGTGTSSGGSCGC